MTSLPLAVNMAAVLFGLTCAEALSGVTREAARALGLAASHGTIEIGKVADFAIYDIARPADLVYAVGAARCRGVVKDGVPVAAWPA